MACESTTCKSDPIKVCPGNPHYLMYKGKPVILVTSAEHYGAVVNMDFDYEAYLDMLNKYGLNYTRIYPGALIEKEGMFIEENTLAPLPGRLAVPWARSAEPGYAGGGNRFDLEKWDIDYFCRLEDFIKKAAERDIIVEICFFNCQHPDGWSYCPLYAANNIQGAGNCLLVDFQTLIHQDLVKIQEAYVRKIVEEVNEFDNIILELCDEPTMFNTPAVLAAEWISRHAGVIIETEDNLPKKHLIAQQLETEVDFTADTRIPIIVTQYVHQNEAHQIGGMEALDSEYAHNKPIEMNETGYYPIWYEGDKIGASRVEAWEFIVGGGAGFNQLNGLYTARNPGGVTPDNIKILETLRNLMHFMYSFEFEKMRQDKNSIIGGIPQGAIYRCISEPGRQYALYIHHSVLTGNNLMYMVMPGNYSADLEIDMPEGTYRADWVDPESGAVILGSAFAHSGGVRSLSSPEYKVDIALRIKAM